MRRADTLRILVDHRAEVAERGVKSLAIFGSVWERVLRDLPPIIPVLRAILEQDSSTSAPRLPVG
jgi:hypothetical protein